MKIQRFIGSKSMRVLAVVMSLMIMLSGFATTGFADGQSGNPMVVAGWDFSKVSPPILDTAPGTTTPSAATEGANKEEARFIGNIGTTDTANPGYLLDKDRPGSVKTYNWACEDGNYNKYWLVSLSTIGYENLTLSSAQVSSGSGPKDFKVQVSLDNSTWIDVSDSELLLQSSSTFPAAGSTAGALTGALVDKPLPSAVANQPKVYLRWVMTSNNAASGSGAVGNSGSRSNIKDIVIKGTALPGTVILDSISLDAASYSLNVGETHQTVVTAVYSDSSTSVVTEGVTYVSSKPDVATVDSAGVVKGKAGGNTIITASFGGRTAQSAVTVSGPAALSGIELDKISYDLDINGTHKSVVTAVYTDDSKVTATEGVTYESSKPEVASVDATGLVTGVSAGTAIITAHFGGKSATADVTVINQNLKTLAGWAFQDEGDKNVFLATEGFYKQASIFEGKGGVSFEEVEAPALSYQGWDEGVGKKYWLAALPTKGFKNITLSSKQASSGSGPKEFKAQISTDQQTWADVDINGDNKTDEGDIITLAKYDYDASTKVADVKLPESADDQDFLYIRWVVASDKRASGDPEGISSSGSSKIKDILVKGESNGTGNNISTRDLVKSPGGGWEDVATNADVTVKFNKDITLTPGYNAVIADEDGHQLSDVTVDLVNADTLKINHPAFAYEKEYTVTIPKELVKGIDNTELLHDCSWSFTVQSSPKTPKLLNMTFNGDPRTSIAFAWYTGTEIQGTKLQVIEASQVINGVFPAQEAIIFTGSQETIKTFMVPDDRESKNYTEFASHKVIVENLKPGIKYAYRAGSGDEDGWSQVGTFTTDKAENQDFHFIAGSDSQGSERKAFEPWQDTFRKAIDKIGDPKFFILSGDLVDNGDLESQWQWFLGLPNKELANVPIVPVLGGHEVKDYDEDETTDNVNFYNHFNLPKDAGVGAHPGSVYSFEYGDALFMQFNSQFAGEIDEEGSLVYEDKEFYAQLDWMRNQVAKTDKKWKFVSFHKSPYAVGDNATLWEGNRIKFYKKYLIPVFDELGIDMVFVAHDHMYMRSFQMLNDKPVTKDEKYKYEMTNPIGTVYVMTNSVGNKFYNRTTEDEDGNPIPPEKLPVDYFSWIDTQPYKKMFMDVGLTKDKLEFTAYTAAVDDGAPQEYDHYYITRTDTKPAKVENADVKLSGGNVVVSWKAPEGTIEPVRGFRIYEKNDRVRANWSAYIPAVTGQVDYSYILNEYVANGQYDFVIKAVGARNNSEPVTVNMKVENTIANPIKQFPQHTSYMSGTIKPNNVTQTQMDQEVCKLYDEWKEKYLTQNKYATSQYYVYYNRNGESDPDTPDAVTTSEAHGYGMLVTALMAGYDQNAKKYFDGLYNFYKAHPSSINPDLMSWQQADRNGTIMNVNGEDSATDGDLDIAYALLLADRQWGSDKGINYLAQAKKIIAAIMKSEINADEHILKLGDWVDDTDPKYGSATRPSDFMLQHLKDFKKVSGDNNWDKVIDKTYSIIQGIHKNYSSGTGLLPDFAVKSGDSYIPPTGNLLETDEDGYYNWNACRTPWRIATDYLMTGDIRAKAQLEKLNSWIRTKTGNNPGNIVAGYKLDGTGLVDYTDTAFTAPFMLSAMIDSSNQQWLNDLWSYNVSQPTAEGAYFGNSIRLLNMIVVSGNWWSPTAVDPEKPYPGGGGVYVPVENTSASVVNSDGSVTIKVQPKFDKAAGTATAELNLNTINDSLGKAKADNNGIKTLEVEIPKVQDARGYECTLPASILSSDNTGLQIVVKTDIAEIKAPCTMLAGVKDARSITLIVAAADKTKLDAGVKAQIGDRPLIEVDLRIDGKLTAWSNENAPITLAVSYNPTADELKDPEHIVVWYIDESGKVVSVPNGRYDKASGKVIFTTDHLSKYAVVYVKRTFNDIGKYPWIVKPVEVLASKGIAEGVEDNSFIPDKKITRGEFIGWLVRTLGLNAEFDKNFEDVDKSDKYYREIGIAKKLGIASGGANNSFSPGREISRQDMMALTVRALKAAKKKLSDGNMDDIRKYADVSKVAGYAVQDVATMVKAGFIKGSGRNLNPTGNTTRAEAAIMLYKIYTKK